MIKTTRRVNKQTPLDKRVRVKIGYKGKIYSCSELARMAGMSRQLLHYRYFVQGLPIERCLTRPVQPQKQQCTLCGKAGHKRPNCPDGFGAEHE